MKIKSLTLSWFRGAATSAALELGSKSAVIYGENGAGKSSFVDAVEYILNDGKIGHLTHEYSGKKQEKAVINTHIPDGEKGKIEVSLADGSAVSVEIQKNGNFSITPDPSPMGGWDYQRTILRQNEVSDFVTQTKGDKYSALLPLLGLSHLEVSAENLRQLERLFTQDPELASKQRELRRVEDKRTANFSNNEDEQLVQEAKRIFKKYSGGVEPPASVEDMLSQVAELLKNKISQQSGDAAKHAILSSIGSSTLKADIDAVRGSALKLSESVEPFLEEKLDALKSASSFALKLEGTEEIKCPACGQDVLPDSLRAHIKDEEQRLRDALENYKNHKANIGSLCDTVQTLKNDCGKTEIQIWRDSNDTGAIAYIKTFNVSGLRVTCTEETLKSIEENLLPLIESAALATKNAPPAIKELIDDQQSTIAIEEILTGKVLQEEITKIEGLVAFTAELQKSFRERIKVQSTDVVGSISGDIRRMWEILHPEEKIEEVKLYLPLDADKAIEIGLKFYGVDQASPRLTLSEGHRNSLGLCIFLAMVKRDAAVDQPLLLDDVVVSFDRNHRGAVAELLEKEFDGKQIILLTHERDWFTELRHQLNAQNWGFQVLMPWSSPDVGISWSTNPSTLSDAQAIVESAPDMAGNRARKIMDISLAIIAEQLKIELPYLHREKNDHRTAHDFLSRIIGASSKCFQIKNAAGSYEPYTEATELFKTADQLLITWGNKSSHTLDVAKIEANKLIKACEAPLAVFTCAECGKDVTRLEDTRSEFKQCTCGKLKWNYGKA